MGYVGILALILLIFGVVVVFCFYRQLNEQQDELLKQKAEAELNGGDRYVVEKATAKTDVAVITLLPDGSTDERLLDEESLSLGLPYERMAREASRRVDVLQGDGRRARGRREGDEHPRDGRGSGRSSGSCRPPSRAARCGGR